MHRVPNYESSWVSARTPHVHSCCTVETCAWSCGRRLTGWTHWSHGWRNPSCRNAYRATISCVDDHSRGQEWGRKQGSWISQVSWISIDEGATPIPSLLIYFFNINLYLVCRWAIYFSFMRVVVVWLVQGLRTGLLLRKLLSRLVLLGRVLARLLWVDIWLSYRFDIRLHERLIDLQVLGERCWLSRKVDDCKAWLFHLVGDGLR